jgi:hypothetical protein
MDLLGDDLALHTSGYGMNIWVDWYLCQPFQFPDGRGRLNCFAFAEV